MTITVTTPYSVLYTVIRNEYLAGDPNDEASTYTRIAFKFIMGCDLHEAIAKYSSSTIMGALKLYLDNESMECECPPDHTSESCFQCVVDKQAKKELKARHNLVQQGVINDG